MKIFVASKLFHNQSDNYSAYNPETGEEITWREIRQLAQEYFDAQEPPPDKPETREDKIRRLQSLIATGLLKTAGDNPINPNLQKKLLNIPAANEVLEIRKAESVVYIPNKTKVVTHKPEGNTQTVTHKEEKKDKVTHSLKSKAKIGELNPKFNGYYGHGKLKYSSASQLAKLHEKPTKTIIQWCKKGKNGYFYEPIQK